ncbi:LOW QUALITY PROTEIN: hypothetical protein KUTeg_007603 [Tegillarca granosa]|uniref:Uncharacterized protein n=1 Tax=Tegillarca granosa TaxID=220873 RepID=A0ABQ9FDQ2_TEGGR|nr:LOW QUALITY PROTEIN: hypothetical protein KUTeg_007603 [Tegillarca granosa]
MKRDEVHVFETVKGDRSLQLLGACMHERVGISHVHNVRQKLRQLARLLVLLRSQDKQPQDTEPITCFSDFISPGNFDFIVACGSFVCLKQSRKKQKEVAQSMINQHWLLKLILQFVQETVPKDKDYLIPHKKEWDEKISSHARQTVAERKYNEPNILTLTEDVVNLRKFLQEINRLIELLNSQPDLKMWRKLALATLCRVTVFNKRRGDETGQMLLQIYQKRQINWNEGGNADIAASLEPIERNLINRLIIDLGPNQEQEWLANHMGHNLSVHKQYYRLQEQTLELAKVSKLLLAVEAVIF